MQTLVLGAGVVGLASARALALAGHQVIVAEATNAIGTGVSSRNSEVIHAGLYYPTGSLRARHCPAGCRMLYELCASHGVPHRKCGKLVVATHPDELLRLEAIHAQALANGVEGVTMISAREVMQLEPALACVAAMLSPETGIVDSHRFMLALAGDLEDHGGVIAFNTPVERLEPADGGWRAHFGGADPGAIVVDAVVNLRRPRRAASCASDRRLSARARPAARPRQGQLFQLRRTAGFLAADLSGSGAGRPRRACDARSRRPHAVRSRRRVDRSRKL